jgi:pimeloyl-ACP methyl ester carboxylesterase
MQIVIDELLTSYNQKGKGKKQLLLLHGWGDTAQTFAKLEKELEVGYQVTSVDLPGFGATQIPPAVWGLDDYASFVQKFAGKLKLRPEAIIAHSNGAAVAIKIVSQEKLVPRKLVLIGAAGIRDKEKAKKVGLKIVAKTGKVATFWLPKRHKRKLQEKLYGAAGSDMLLVPHLQETFKRTVGEDVQKEAATITIPTLLIYGENDRATPPSYGELYHRLMPHSTLKLVKGAEHFVHQDEPEQVNLLIEEYLQ